MSMVKLFGYSDFEYLSSLNNFVESSILLVLPSFYSFGDLCTKFLGGGEEGVFFFNGAFHSSIKLNISYSAVC